MIVVTGGSASGKSAFAEDYLVKACPGKKLYIATMKPYDKESFSRIFRHQKMREKKDFSTLECYYNLKEASIEPGCGILLECMSNLVANEMFLLGKDSDQIVEEVLEGLEKLEKQAKLLVVVTNEIFQDGKVYEESTKNYQECLARINKQMAKRAKKLAEVVYGIALWLK
ncbi:MAG TPA: bifunctional adenosylcobinamide kinase/adenosylcobinamide-phosphate guanylyltransferase [Lachnospiraceae bacterium]